ncbi:hypothetical protein PAAG_11122 [Paracoccidioides lutzii Pb01]|uniref:Uncharacterized protein n=1 Tax=Paracoccidioides lutzii (strain ATCC MYA-826 / Pb01) TaxID=502779 RepID=A0A0A2V7A2_PARBA|nr:hypothetical protein PAAG_11122 [Paracoccidioides lutzii Pb01]KGQ02167.1 hypothetical protein PAAG_11122 [Paracoccidioides lutzii Pb01]
MVADDGIGWWKTAMQDSTKPFLENHSIRSLIELLASAEQKPQGSFPRAYEEEYDQVPEPSSAGEGETEYKLAGLVCDESDDGTPSPTLTPIPMPSPNASGMITVTAADLFAFCQQMMATRENARVQASIDTKAVTTFDGTNYQAYRIGILADAEVIGGTDILTKNQHEPPEEYDTNPVEKERWIRISIENTVSLAEERMNVMKELSTLFVKDNDYLAYQRRFRYLVARHKKLATKTDDFYHDLFLNGLRDHQRAFAKTCLDDFYATGQDQIVNMDINNLMKQLTNRTSKTTETERTKIPRVNAVTNDGNPQLSASTSTSTSTKSKDKNKNSKEDKANDKMPNLLASRPSADSAIALSVSSEISSKPWYLAHAPALI